MTVGPDKGVAGCVVSYPDLHVCAGRGVANVQRVEEDDPGVVEFDQLLLHPPQPILTDDFQVRELETRLSPFRSRKLARAQRVPVERSNTGGRSNLGPIATAIHSADRLRMTDHEQR